jgi:hypothetical protein
MVPSDKFIMGSPTTKDGFDDATTKVHSTKLPSPGPSPVSRFEVTFDRQLLSSAHSGTAPRGPPRRCRRPPPPSPSGELVPLHRDYDSLAWPLWGEVGCG